jgi:hypothetical protein
MAKQGISTGTTPNDGTGDSLLDGALKINSNFTEIYDTLGDGSTIGSNANFTGVVTATSFDGELVGSAVTSYSGGLTVTGVTTSTGGFVGTLIGNVTGTISTATVAINAQGLIGSPNVTVENINVGTAITIGSGNTQTTNSIELTGTVDSVSVITDRLNSGIATFTENVYLGDSDHLYFGDGSDLDIYHSGTDNFIVGSTGVIHMRNDDIKIQSGAGNTNYARFRDTGVELYQDTYKRFETTDAGIKVTGGVESTGISTFSNNVNITGTVISDQLNVSGVSTFSDGGARFTSIQNDAITFNSNDNSARIQGTGYGGLSISPGGPGDSISIATYGIFSSGGDVTLNNGVANRTTNIGGRLRVTGISTFQNDLIVGTATTGVVVTPEGNLNVSGISTFNNSLILDNGSSDIRLQHNISGTEKSKLIFRSSGAIDYYANNGMTFFATSGASPINRRLQLLTAGGVKVEYKNNTRLETTSDGVEITGTLDVSGISTFSGNVSVGVDTSVGVVLTSPNGTKYRLMVENDGSLATVAI